MIPKWLSLLLLIALLSACTYPTPTPTIPPTPIVQSRPRFQVFILNSLTTCLVGNEFASGNVCAGTACRDGKQDFSETGVDTGWPCP